MGQASEDTVVIPSDRAAAERVERAIAQQLKDAGYSEQALFAVRLAVDEALANAIHHGNRDDPAKHVTIEYQVTPEVFRITITDEGGGFRPEGLPDPTARENLERPNGRGVMLMRAYMTEVSFNEAGNAVTLVKRRDCDLPRRDKAQ